MISAVPLKRDLVTLVCFPAVETAGYYDSSPAGTWPSLLQLPRRSNQRFSLCTRTGFAR
jgi:hypothetical protein